MHNIYEKLICHVCTSEILAYLEKNPIKLALYTKLHSVRMLKITRFLHYMKQTAQNYSGNLLSYLQVY